MEDVCYEIRRAEVCVVWTSVPITPGALCGQGGGGRPATGGGRGCLVVLN